MKKNESLTEEQELLLIEKKREKAKKLIANEKQFDEFLSKLELKLKEFPAGEQLSYIPIMIAMVKSYLKKEYPDIPMNTLVSIVACLIYWLSPIDLIPDATPVVGYVDDTAFMAGIIIGGVAEDVKKYIEWREGQINPLLK